MFERKGKSGRFQRRKKKGRRGESVLEGEKKKRCLVLRDVGCVALPAVGVVVAELAILHVAAALAAAAQLAVLTPWEGKKKLVGGV